MKNQMMSPLQGPPFTAETTDEAGKPAISVYPSAVGPWTAKWSDRIGLAAGFGAVIAATLASIRTPSLWGEQASLIAGAGPAGWFFSRYAFRQIFKSRASVVFTPDTILLRRTLGKTKVFNRNVTHSFARIQHDKSETEARRIRWLETTFGKKWFNLPYKPYCGRSQHIALIYLNQRHTIMTVYGDRQSEQIHARLMATSDIMDGYANRGVGQVMSPSDDWTPPSQTIVESF